MSEPYQEESDDTVDIPRMESAVDETGGKSCCQCGKDLRGHRRFKDSVGYWCKDCHRVDKARHTIPEGRCPDCGRMRPLDKLYMAGDGSNVCSQCLKIRQEKAEKYAVHDMIDKERKKIDRAKLYALFAALIILGLIVLWQNASKMSGH